MLCRAVPEAQIQSVLSNVKIALGCLRDEATLVSYLQLLEGLIRQDTSALTEQFGRVWGAREKGSSEERKERKGGEFFFEKENFFS